MKHIRKLISRYFRLRIVFVYQTEVHRSERRPTVTDLKVRYYPLSRDCVMYVLLK